MELLSYTKQHYTNNYEDRWAQKLYYILTFYSSTHIIPTYTEANNQSCDFKGISIWLQLNTVISRLQEKP